jgi:hypothetical protein
MPKSNRLKWPLLLAALALMIFKIVVLSSFASRSKHIPEPDEKP